MRIQLIYSLIKTFLYSVLLTFPVFSLHAQASDSTGGQPAKTEFAFRVHYGVIYAHTFLVENTAGAHPRGFEFEISKQLTDRKSWDYYRCFPRTGFAFSYFDLNTPILGRSYSASYFLEPNYRLSKTCDFFLRGAVGLSYLTNPHDSLKNPANQSYSLPVNFFLSLGIGLNFKLTHHIALNFMASFQHNSNGGFQLPNHGVNYPTASIGVRYNVVDNSFPVYKKVTSTSWKRKLAFDAGLFYSPKSGYKYAWVSQRRFVIGAYSQISRQVSTLDAITLAGEIYYDDGLKSIKKILGDNTPCTLAGIMIGHEFIFRRIYFSQQLGVYVYKNTQTFSQLYQQAFPLLYHRWGLRYKLDNHWFAGFNMLVHKQVADFIDVRLSYRF